MNSESKNLEAIYKAIDKHDAGCSQQLVAIEMCHFEVERLGWDEIRGIPLRVNEKVPSGRFNLVCEGDLTEPEQVVTEAVSSAPV